MTTDPRPMTNEEVVAAMVLIERDALVPISARTLTHLVSYALAGPSTDLEAKYRDEAVQDAHVATVAEFQRLRASGALPSHSPRGETRNG